MHCSLDYAMISLKADHLKRYRDLARIFMRYGLLDVVKNASEDDPLARDPAVAVSGGTVGDLAGDLEKMGPAYIKLGQLLSTRADLFPAAYLGQLTRLQDNVEPFPYADVEAIVHTELGIRISKAFSWFEEKPLAAASLGQVHRAALRDGRVVAVKVQRPGIRQEIWKEFEILTEVAGLFDRHTSAGRKLDFASMIEEFRKTLALELDYRVEALNLQRMRDNLRDFDGLFVPAPIDHYTTSRVLTMEYVHGIKITTLSHVCLTEIDGPRLARQLFQAYLRMLCVDGFLHADPHPGNVFITEDNRIALLDLGMVARITPSLQDRVLQLLVALSEGRGEDAAGIATEVGTPSQEFRKAAFERAVVDLVKKYQGMRIEDVQVGRAVLDVTNAAADNGLSLPPESTMVGQTLLKLDQVGRILDPKFDPSGAIREHATDLTTRRLWKSLPSGSLLNVVLESRNFLGKLPGRVNRILDMLANNDVKIRADVVDEAILMEGIQKVANRITTGLVIAALIVGAAILAHIPTRWSILGYPALAMLFFLLGAIGGVILLFQTLWKDVKAERSPRNSPPPADE